MHIRNAGGLPPPRRPLPQLRVGAIGRRTHSILKHQQSSSWPSLLTRSGNLHAATAASSFPPWNTSTYTIRYHNPPSHKYRSVQSLALTNARPLPTLWLRFTAASTLSASSFSTHSSESEAHSRGGTRPATRTTARIRQSARRPFPRSPQPTPGLLSSPLHSRCPAPAFATRASAVPRS